MYKLLSLHFVYSDCYDWMYKIYEKIINYVGKWLIHSWEIYIYILVNVMYDFYFSQSIWNHAYSSLNTNSFILFYNLYEIISK